MKIVIGTGNKSKIEEISAILSAEEWQLSSLPNVPEPDEPYSTFIENACHKAKYYGDLLKMPVLSDDTGLCVNALDQFPGVRTKDFVEENGGFCNAFDVLEVKLKNISDRSAMFVCAAAVYIPQLDLMLCHEAKEPGQLIFPGRGDGGFGFDPVFVPDGYQQTMAELGIEVKNQYGHRALAIKNVAQQLREMI